MAKPVESTDFGRMLKEKREAAGLSKTELAALVKRDRATIFNLECGKHEPSWPLVIRLADALGVSTEAFRLPPKPDTTAAPH